MNTRSSFWTRIEPWLFWIITTIHVVPLFVSKWFITLDGPVHLYGARLVRDLVLNEPFISKFFHLNHYPDPYWFGQAVGAALMTFIPAWVVEKLVWGSSIIGLAWSFRFFIGTIAPERKWASLLIMPFLLAHTIWMGYQNFCLSFPLMFIAITLVMRGAQGSCIRIPALAMVLLALYFAHLSTFFVTIAVIGSVIVWLAIVKDGADPKQLRRVVVALGVSAILPLVFTVLYFSHVPPAEVASTRIELMELVSMIWSGRVFNGFGLVGEHVLCAGIALTFCLVGISAMIFRINQFGRQILRSDSWLLISIVGLVAYFILPDAMAGGFNTSARLLLFAMLFLCCWLVISPTPNIVLGVIIVIVVPLDLYHLKIQSEGSAALGKECNELLILSPTLRNGMVLLPLNYSSNWLHSNFSNYMGVLDEHVVVMDNFIANTQFGPVQWNTGMSPLGHVGDHTVSNDPCVRLNAYSPGTKEQVNAVLTWKREHAQVDSCYADVDRQLDIYFVESASSPFRDAVLYLRK
ncbi:MAG: hypothetical protein KA408_03835 [Flavobacteriales bacterium]|jgi:hypothetical protein|nr:hypothetical protein [Flavobacteriales bacterium]